MTKPTHSTALDEKISEVLKPFHQTGCPFSKDYGKCVNGDCDHKRKAALTAIKNLVLEARLDELELLGEFYPPTKKFNIRLNLQMDARAAQLTTKKEQ